MTETPADVLDAVISLIRSLAQDGDLPCDLASTTLTGETPLDQLGLDSLGKLNLLTAIDERLRIYIPDDAIFPGMTVGALAHKLAGRRRR